MSVENPDESRVIATQMLSSANAKDSSTDRVKALMAMSKSSHAFGLDVEALGYIDSAIALAHRSIAFEVEAEALLDKLVFCLQCGNQELAKSTVVCLDKLAKTCNLQECEIRKLLVMGDYYKQKSAMDEAIRQKEQALSRSVDLGNNTLIAECQQGIGSLYWYFGNYKQALVYYMEALALWKKDSNTNGTINVLKNIGLAHRSLGQFEEAAQNFSDALDLTIESQNKSEQAVVLNLKGGLDLVTNKLDVALENFEASYTIFENQKMLKSAVATLQNIARTYAKKQSFHIALQYLNDALRMQEQLVDPISESSILNEIGNLNLQKGDVTEALKRYLMSLKIRKSCGDNELVAKSLVNIGIAYRRIGMLSNAAKYLEQVVELVDGNYLKPIDAAYALQNLAHIYSDQKLYNRAIATYRKSLIMSERTGDEIQMCRILCNVAQTQIKNQQFDEAQESLMRAHKIALKKDSKIENANIYNELGNVERYRLNYEQAIVYYAKGAELYASINNESGRGLCLRKIGEVQTELGNFAEAAQKIDESIVIAQQTENQYLLQYGYYAEYQMYKARGSYKNALDSYVKYVEIKDSIQSTSHNEKSIEAQINLELDQKTTEIKLMEAEMEVLKNKTELDNEKLARQSMVRNFLVVFTILVAFIAAILVVAFVQKRRHAHALEEKIVEINLVNNKLIRSEKELKETIQSKDKLFSIVAHDLRSPFTALLGLTEIMATQAGQFTNEEMADFSSHVNKSAQNVLSLIENLLHWSRSQTGRLVVNPQRENLLNIVQKVVATAKIAAATKNIELKVDVNPDLFIFADPDTITTVVRNLVSNAIKFTNNNGEVKVSAARAGDGVEIVVADNGIGISHANMDKLFRIDGVTTKGTNDEGGTGLGLVVCREFVEKNGGTIAVESVEGKGTTFRIQLKTA